jgi:hypothetical protein
MKPSMSTISTSPTPDEWVGSLGEAPIELASPYDLVTDENDRATIPEREHRREVAHTLAVAIRQARLDAVGTQVAAAQAWGRTQSQVSRLESDPSVVQLGTLLDYLSSIGVELSLHLSVGGRLIEVDEQKSTTAA